MSENLKACLGILLYVSKLKNKNARKRLLFILGQDSKIYKSLQEILLNVTKGNIKLTTARKRALQKDAKTIISIIKRKKRTKSQRAKYVTQSGGFLPALLPIVASTLLNLVLK